MSDFTEKRRYPRCAVKYIALIDTGKKDPLVANISNVSKTGLLLNSTSELNNDNTLEIIIKKENSPLEPISATGNIVWEKEGSDSHEVGIHFSKIRWSETDRLIHNLRF